MSKLKKIIPIVVIVVAVIIAVVAIYAILVGPSKEPYRQASTQYRNVYSANIALTNAGNSINATAASDQEFSENIKRVEQRIESLKIENEALAKQAVLQEGEGKALYDAFNTKLAQYIAYNNNILSSIEAVRPVLFDCTRTSVTLSDTGVAKFRSCAARMGALSDIADSDYRSLAKAYAEIFTDAADTIQKIIVLQDPNGLDSAKKTSLTEELNGYLVTDATAASNDLRDGLREHRSGVDITNQAIALDEFLSDKASLF